MIYLCLKMLCFIMQLFLVTVGSCFDNYWTGCCLVTTLIMLPLSVDQEISTEV